MLDLDKKVGNAVCANTKATGKTIELENSENKREPYRVDIPTGCRREPKKKRRFCESCICEFAVTDSETSTVMFLESLHPLGCGRRMQEEGTERFVHPGSD